MVIIIDGMITTNVSSSRNITRLIISTIVMNVCETFSSIIVLPMQIDLIMNSAIQPFFRLCMFCTIWPSAASLFPGCSPSGYDQYVIG